MTNERNPHLSREGYRHTLDYRAAEASLVMDWIRAGQSGCIVGLRGAGKSNFLWFLLRPDVRQHYLNADPADFVFIFIDLVPLPEPTEWSMWELILDQLIAELRVAHVDAKEVDEIAGLHKEVLRSRDALIAQRAIEQGLKVLGERPTRHVVLIFDEFDAAFGSADRALFLGLRALRDMHKDRLSYIVVATRDLVTLRQDIGEIERFHQLVSQNVCELGPCNEADARQIISYHAAKRSLEVSADDSTRLIELSGGHAGLLKTMLRLLWSAPPGRGLDELAPTLSAEPLIQSECRKVWDSLAANEQSALRVLAASKSIDPLNLERLKRRGLVRSNPARHTALFSPLFVDFVRRQSITAPLSRVSINRDTRDVEIDGRKVKNLTELEFEAFCYLYEHRGQVCTKDELIANVYRLQHERMKGGVSDETLQTLISRLRDKIEPDRGPRYVLTVRGEGYRFVEPGER
jgi:DNA-binding winged helix-turn-helix (wHTH) protein